MVIVNLKDEVKGAIRKAGSDINIVCIEEDSPSTVGLCHLKLRHFDHFLEYFLEKNDLPREEATVEDYCKARQLPFKHSCILKEYRKKQDAFAARYDALVRACPDADGKIMRALIPGKKKRHFFDVLLGIVQTGNLQARCHDLDSRCAELLEIEAENIPTFSGVHRDMKSVILPVVLNPWRVYKELKNVGTYAFCSEKDEHTFVLGLSVSESIKGRGDLITGFLRGIADFDDKPDKYKQIYEAKQDGQ